MTNSLTPEDARAQCVDLLNDTVYQALGLKEILLEEQHALESQDTDALETTVESKSACVSRLQHLDQQRNDLCRACGFEAGPEQMPELIKWCDDKDQVKSRWDHLMIVAAESSALNMTNGAIIRVRQQHFESSLSVLRGVNPGTDTYGRHGEESGGYGQRSLAEA